MFLLQVHWQPKSKHIDYNIGLKKLIIIFQKECLTSYKIIVFFYKYIHNNILKQLQLN